MAYERRAIPWLAAGQKVGKAPLAPGLARGERGTWNHGWMARAVELVVNGDPDELCEEFYAREREQGHMGRECMSASHWQHHAGAHAAILLEAQRWCQSYEAVENDAIDWFATQLALCRRFYEPGVRRGSVVSPGARGWGGWKKGSVPSNEQHSWMRDEWLRYVDLGKPFKGSYSPGLDAECVQLLTHPDMPYARIREAADRVKLDEVRLVAPIYEHRIGGLICWRWWWPPAAVTRTRPTVYVSNIKDGKHDTYICDPERARDHIGREPAQVQIGRAPR